MRKRPGIFLAIGFLVLAGVSGAAGGYLYWNRLPDPATADREGLVRWLVARDLTQESLELRQTLAVRLEEEVYAGAKMSEPADGQLSSAQAELLRRNIELLVEDWFRMKAADYQTTPPANRVAELDRQLDGLQNSGIVDQVLAAQQDQEKPADPVQAMNRLVQKMKVWVERTAPQQRDEVRQFAAAVQGRIFVRALEALAGPKGE